ncbi:hypothetical protein AVL50_29385 [Flammeovirga sp. SJP92]|nr:hypothetical protein AVL50_29385 [Flammeovirga sp. SJP92]
MLAQQLELGLPLGHKSPISFTEFSDDGQYIISSAYDGTYLWETYTGRFIKKLDGEQYRFQDLQTSERGKLLLTVHHRKNSIHLWDFDKGQLLKTFKGTSAYLSPDGQWVATYSNYYGITQIWDTGTLSKKGELKGYLKGFVDQETLLMKLEQYQAIDIKTLKAKYQIEPAQGRQYIQLLKNLDFFAIINDESSVLLYRKTDGALLQKHTFQHQFHDVTFDKEGAYWGINFENDSSKIFLRKKTKNKLLKTDQSTLLDFLKDKKGNTMALQLKDGNLVAQLIDSGKEVYRINGFDEGLCGFRVSADQNYLSVVDCASINDYVAEIGANNGFLLLNAQSGQFINAFFSSVDELMSCTLSEDRKYLSNITHSYASTFFDLTNGQLKHVLKTEYAVTSEFTNDHKYLITYSDQRAIDTGSDLGAEILNQDSQWVWDIETGDLMYIKDVKYSNSYGQAMFDLIEVDYDDRKIVHLNKEDDNGWVTPYMDLIGHTDTVYFTELSKDQKIAITASLDQTAKVWDAITGKMLCDITPLPSKVKHAQFFQKKNQLLLVLENEQQMLWDLTIPKQLMTITLPPKKERKSGEISNQQYKVVNDYDQNILNVYVSSTNQLLHKLTEHQDLITSFQFINNTHYLVSSSYDGSTIFWDLKTGKPILKQLVFEQKYPVWLLPNGYYMATKASAQRLFYKKGIQTVGFEQLDVKYNRPDKVLAIIDQISGAVDSTMIKAYRKAWEKRIKKLDIDTASFDTGFSIPECTIENRNGIAYEQTKGELLLEIKAVDSLYYLDRYNVWINEVPVFGEKGISIRKNKTHSIAKTIALKLSKGSNKIEVSVTNNNGIESYRFPLNVNYTPKKTLDEKLFFVGIGVDHYQEKGYDLQYSVKDIRDLSRQLKIKYGDKIVIDTLFDQNVTVDNILQLKERLKNTSVDDKVLISFSGHGLLSEDLDYYLATYNVNFEQPQEQGLPYEELEFLLDGIPSRKKLLLIDACHSGEVDKDEIASIRKVQNEKEGLKGLIVIMNKKTKVGLKNSFELMKELFNNIDRSTGTTVISAAAGTQFAQERGDLRNGVFTYCILNQMMNKETITVSELKKAVSQQVQEITNGLQQPTSRNETIENNWKVW